MATRGKAKPLSQGIPPNDVITGAIDTHLQFITELHRRARNKVPEALQSFPKMYRQWSSFARRNLSVLTAEAPTTTNVQGRARKSTAKAARRGKAAGVAG